MQNAQPTDHPNLASFHLIVLILASKMSIARFVLHESLMHSVTCSHLVRLHLPLVCADCVAAKHCLFALVLSSSSPELHPCRRQATQGFATQSSLNQHALLQDLPHSFSHVCFFFQHRVHLNNSDLLLQHRCSLLCLLSDAVAPRFDINAALCQCRFFLCHSCHPSVQDAQWCSSCLPSPP